MGASSLPSSLGGCTRDDTTAIEALTARANELRTLSSRGPWSATARARTASRTSTPSASADAVASIGTASSAEVASAAVARVVDAMRRRARSSTASLESGGHTWVVEMRTCAAVAASSVAAVAVACPPWISMALSSICRHVARSAERAVAPVASSSATRLSAAPALNAWAAALARASVEFMREAASSACTRPSSARGGLVGGGGGDGGRGGGGSLGDGGGRTGTGGFGGNGGNEGGLGGVGGREGGEGSEGGDGGEGGEGGGHDGGQ